VSCPTCGCEVHLPPFEPLNPPPVAPTGTGTTLVTDLSVPATRTIREETDSVWAMRRGLREYLAQAQKVIAGQVVQFIEVFEEWATTEDVSIRYPSAAVLLADGLSTFDASDFSPRIHPDDKLPDGRYVVKTAEVSTDFIIEIHCSEPGDRVGVAMLMEETLNPVDFMYGFVLELPFYFGQRALFQTASFTATDTEASARHGVRPLLYRVSGSISVVRPRSYPVGGISLELCVEQTTQPLAPPTVHRPFNPYRGPSRE